MSVSSRQHEESHPAGDRPSMDADPHRSVTEFVGLVNLLKPKYQGRNGRHPSRRQPYIPYNELVGYWDPKRIRDVLQTSQLRTSATIATIRSQYLRVFSLLVYINKAKHLHLFMEHEFTDLDLRRDTLGDWLRSPSFEGLERMITTHRWLFCPLTIDENGLSGHRVSEDVILPFHSEGVISKTDSSIVTKVETPGSPPSELKVFAIKSYSRKNRSYFDNEAHTLVNIRDLKNAHIIGFYGSFLQGDTHNIVLRYIGGGNLHRYFDRTKPPSTAAEARTFWDSLSTVVQGLDALHRLETHESISKYLGVHEDLKPDNILLSMGHSGSPYDFVPVIADFGHSHIKPMQSGELDRSVPDRHGNQEFAAPEASKHSSWRRNSPARVTPQADIWSIGCILSVAAAWVAQGASGITEYDKLRQTETETCPNFEEGSSRRCFHDGRRPLEAVSKMHIIVTQKCRDTVTPKVVKLLENDCIVGDLTRRKTARTLFESLRETVKESSSPRTPIPQPKLKLLSNITSELKEALPLFPARGKQNALPGLATSLMNKSVPIQGNAHASAASPSHQGSSPPAPNSLLQIDSRAKSTGSRDGARTSPDNDLGSPLSPNRLSPSGRSSRIPSWWHRSPSDSPYTMPVSPADAVLTMDQCHEWASAMRYKYCAPDADVNNAIYRLQTQLKDREHVFIVDDSPRMRAHKDSVRKVLDTFLYIARKMDPNRLELIFASRPTEIHRSSFFSSSSRSLLEAFDRCAFDHIEGLMEKGLRTIVQSIIDDKLAPGPQSAPCVSVFVLTDGGWGDDHNKACGVENPIKRLMDFTRKYFPGDRTRVMVQFLRFGDDECGIRHLNFLDKFGASEGWDIVDHKPITGNVISIFTGSISRKGDEEDEEQHAVALTPP